MSSSRKDVLVWLDLEMSGLADHDVILEIASVVTDTQLNLIAKGPDMVVWQPDAILEAMGPWCQKQHAQSGLYQAVQQSVISLDQAEQQTLTFLKHYCQANTVPLCGNSIGTDRRFLRRWMPTLEAFFHYRQIDVTSIKLLAQYWSDGHCAFSAKKMGHRAMDDILESIEELKYYRGFMFQYDEFK